MSVETRHKNPDPRSGKVAARGPEDRRMPAERTRPGPGLPLEIGFLAAYGVPPKLLLIAGTAARQLGVTPDQALFGAGFPEDTFYRLLARHLGAPYLDDPVRLKLSPADLPLAQRAGIAPLVPNPRGLGYVLVGAMFLISGISGSKAAVECPKQLLIDINLRIVMKTSENKRCGRRCCNTSAVQDVPVGLIQILHRRW